MIYFILSLLLGVTTMIQSESDFTKKVESKDMLVAWKYRGAFVIFKMQSKSSGWFAIGLNESSEIKKQFFRSAL
jgi:hypothetical protein